MNDPSHNESLTTTPARGGRRSRIPPKWLLGVLLVAVVVAGIVSTTDLVGDHARANTLAVAVLLAVFPTLFIWFVGFSGFSPEARIAVLASSVAAITGFFVCFRIDHLTGELIPSFAFRFSPRPDQRLAKSEGTAARAVDLRTTTDDDFPQFLGPQRNASVDRVKLARDWKAQPPQLVWRRAIGAGWSAFSAAHGYAVTMEQRGDQEMVTCYDIRTGQPQWTHAFAACYDTVTGGIGPRSTPAIAHGLVYALGATGHLVCLDGSTGKCRWEKNLLEEFGVTAERESVNLPWGRSNSPLVVDGLLIVPAGGRKDGPPVSLVAYDARDGHRVWQGGHRQISYSSPTVATLAGRRQILIVNESSASGHDLKTGRVLWEHPWPARSNANPNVSQAVPVPPDRVFLSKGYGQGSILLQLVPKGREDQGDSPIFAARRSGQSPEESVFETKVVWRDAKILRTKFTNVAVLDGFAYGLSDGVLECAELATGRRFWKEGRYQHGQLLRAGDLLLVLSESGEILLIEATPDRPNRVLGRFQAVTGPTWNNLALYGPYLLVRNAQAAACYRLPLAHGAPVSEGAAQR